MKFLRKWLKWLIGKNIPDELFACKTKEEKLSLYNNKWNNLREVTNQENKKNSTISSKSKMAFNLV